MSANWKTVRVFISSTFRDMQAERDHLVRFVFPRLREQFLPRRIHLVDVDLRWGVTSEQDASEVCREIINECRPRFLCMLGGRYGWVPPAKTRSITADEVHFGVLDRTLTDRGFAYFYFRDKVATAAMQETTAGEFHEPQGSENENKLADLKQAIKAASLNPFTYPARWDNDSRRLTDLKTFGEHVCDDLLTSMKSDPEVRDRFVAETAARPDEFDEENEAMEAFIEERSQRFVLGSREPVLNDLLAHASATGGNGYVCLTGAPGSGKSALLAYLYREMTNPPQSSTESTRDSTASVSSVSFRGQSAVVISHFVGSSAGSTDVWRTLRRLCHELKAGCPDIIADIPNDLEKLRIAFPDFLRRACAQKRVVILLDAVNQFDSASHSAGLHWLPEELPANTRVILSLSSAAGSTVRSSAFTRSGATEPPEGRTPNATLDELRRRRNPPKEMELQPLTAVDGEAIIEQFRKRYRKKFETDQRAALLAKTGAGTPLYLLAALEELRTLGTYEEITRRIAELPPTTHELFAWIIERLENDEGFRDGVGRRVGYELVSRFAALLGASRYGLSQREVVDLLDAGDPQGNVAALLHLLRPYLMRRGELLDFYHGQFREAVQSEYLDEEEERLAAHRTLATYFQRKADPTDDGSWKGDYQRSFSELPYHTFNGRQYGDSVRLGRDNAFLNAQARAFPSNPNLPLETIRQALQAAATIDDSAAMAEFVLRHARHVDAAADESPFDALRAGNLERAWTLADLVEIQSCSLWYLLLACELKNAGKPAAARATLCRMQMKQVPRLSGWQEECASDLLFLAYEIDQDAFHALTRRLLDDQALRRLMKKFALKGQFATATRLAQNIDHARWRAPALGEIAAAQAKSGQDAHADHTLNLALNAARELPDPDGAFFNICSHMAEAGQLDRALGLLHRIRSIYTRDHALREIATAQGEAGHVVAAFETAQSIDHLYERSKALCEIATIQISAGYLELGVISLATVAKTATKIRDLAPKANVLCKLAVAQDRAGQMDAAAASFDAAIVSARQIAADDRRGAAMGTIVAAQISAGQLTAAMQAALRIDDRGWRDQAMSDIASAQAQVGQFSAALKLVQAVENLGARKAALSVIAAEQSKARELSVAIETALSYENVDERTAGLMAITEAQAEAGHFAAALESADKIQDGYEQGRAWCEIVKAQARLRQFRPAIDEACKMTGYWRDVALRGVSAELLKSGGFSMALECAARSGDSASALRQIASVQAHSDQHQAAITSFAASLAKQPHSSGYTQWCLDSSMCDIVHAHANAGEFATAMTLASCIRDCWDHVKALLTVAVEQCRFGQVEPALANFSAARALAHTLDTDCTKEAALNNVAVAQCQAGQFADALITAGTLSPYASPTGHVYCETAVALAKAGRLVEALELAPKIKHDGERVKALCGVALVQAQSGHTSEAITSYSMAMDVSAESWTGEERAEFLCLIASSQARAGMIGAALHLISHLVPSQRALVYSEIAVAKAKSGEIKESSKSFAAALNEVGQITGLVFKVDALRSIGCAQAHASRTEEAVRTFGVAESLCESDEKFRDYSLGNIAVDEATVGFCARAARTAQAMVVNRGGCLTRVAEIPVDAGDREGFKHFLIPCAYDLYSASRICGLLARLYPKSATPLATLLLSEVGATV